MKPIYFSFIAAAMLVLSPFTTRGCTLSADSSLASKFEAASFVVLAEVQSAYRTAGSSDPGGAEAVEVVSFKLIHSWIVWH
jgi:hypothetical protein